ncbi:MAG: hypothetical protein HY927_11465 [Elusimicrobia bacterium]|nr:hypothetical protein [Elusimicrobiota bacterium]
MQLVENAVQKANAVMDPERNKNFGALLGKKVALEKKFGLRDKVTGKPVSIVSDAEFEGWDEFKKSRYLNAGGMTHGMAGEKLLTLPEKDQAQFASVVKSLAKYEERRNQLRQEAIETAMEVLHISPERRSGPIESGPPVRLLPDGTPDPEYEESFIGRQATWRPRYAPNLPLGRWGQTSDDGRVKIGPDAFEYAGRLFLAIYHEGLHFDRLMTKGLDLRNNPAWEVKERELARPYLETRFGLKGTDISDYDAFVAQERINAEKWEGQIREGLDPYEKRYRSAFVNVVYPRHPPQADSRPEFITGPDSEALQAIQKQAKDLREKTEKAALLQGQLKTLGDIAQEVCLSGLVVTQERLDAFTRLDPQLYLDALPKGKSPFCSDELYEAMLLKLAHGERLDAGWVNAGRERSSEEVGKRRQLEDLRLFADQLCKDPDRVSWRFLEGLIRHESALYEQAERDSGLAISCELEAYRFILGRLRLGERFERDRLIRRALFHGGAPPTPASGAANDLRLIAAWACYEPGHINEETHIRPLDKWFFPNPRLLDREEMARDLSGCAKELYWTLVKLNDTLHYGETLNPAWLNAEGKRLKEQYEKPQPGPGRPVGGGGGDDGSGSGGRGGGIDPKPSMPRKPDWDGRGPH